MKKVQKIKKTISNPSMISFDYAIKYLLKDKGDYSIVEDFISSILETEGYKPVKIIALLEPESNKENVDGKRSLADVVVEDENHQKYIIEIERNTKATFVHKAFFNVSRLVVDNLPEGSDYHHIAKIFHISLLYFPLSNEGGSVYHGKTIVHEVRTKEKLNVRIRNPLTGAKFNATDVFPEYFFISVPAFNDQLESKIDEWLYVLKHSKVLDTFTSPYMKQVAEKLSILKMNKEEHQAYIYYRKQLLSLEDEFSAREEIGIEKGMRKGLKKGKAIGIEKGEAIGIEKGIEKTALTMLELNVDIKTIAQYTSLPLEHILHLQSLKRA